MRAVIVSGELVQDQELIYPLYRLKEAGYVTALSTQDGKPFKGIAGVKFEPTMGSYELEVEDFDLVVIPGGVKAMEHMRLDERLVEFIKSSYMAGKRIAAICSGTQMLISAGLCKGLHITGYPAIKVDIENAGGIYVDMPAVVDSRIITSPHYRYLGEWMTATLMAMV